MRLAILVALLTLAGCGSFNHHANDLWRIPQLTEGQAK